MIFRGRSPLRNGDARGDYSLRLPGSSTRSFEFMGLLWALMKDLRLADGRFRNYPKAGPQAFARARSNEHPLAWSVAPISCLPDFSRPIDVPSSALRSRQDRVGFASIANGRKSLTSLRNSRPSLLRGHRQASHTAFQSIRSSQRTSERVLLSLFTE